MVENKDEKSKLDGILVILRFLYLLGALLLCAFVLVLIASSKSDTVKELGAVGDSINGVSAPILGLMVVIVTFLAFWVQFEANQELRRDIKIDRFETRFYELLRLHQENVNSIDIAGKFSGRKAFVRMYNELRFIYGFIEEQCADWNRNELNAKIKEDNNAFMEVAYTIFFFGLREVSSGRITYQHKIHAPFLTKLKRELKEAKKKNKVIKNNKTVYNLKATSVTMGKISWNPTYTPFEGQVSKLGHYYRHLYQLIKFISTNTSLKLTFKEKYEYIKIVRAQLSNHEQVLIYFNSFFSAGNIWWEEINMNFKNERGEVISYFLDYRIIKNLPFNLTRFGPDPVNEFTLFLKKRGRSQDAIEVELNELFEWIGG
ncbi:MAG: putative phage abortive infection protein [Cyclobacteriaceae bacterium]